MGWKFELEQFAQFRLFLGKQLFEFSKLQALECAFGANSFGEAVECPQRSGTGSRAQE